MTDEGGGGGGERRQIDEPMPLPVLPRAGAKSDRRRRALLGAFAGLIVFALTFEASWSQTREMVWSSSGGGAAAHIVNEMQADVDAYVKATGQVPTSLQQVPDAARRDPLDPWGHPYQLTITNGRPVVSSLGQDGLPGGVGLDADVVAPPWPSRYYATRRQYLRHMPLVPLLIVCFAAAVATALVPMVGGGASRGEPLEVSTTLAKMALTGVAAIAAGSIIAAVHAPSGH